MALALMQQSGNRQNAKQSMLLVTPPHQPVHGPQGHKKCVIKNVTWFCSDKTRSRWLVETDGEALKVTTALSVIHNIKPLDLTTFTIDTSS